MKSMYLMLLAFGVTLSTSAQISSFPYLETFAKTSPLTGWTVDHNSIWYHDTTIAVIRADNHVQTGYYWNLYSPWFNTSGLTNPVAIFNLKVMADSINGCVPELDFEYDDSTGSGYYVLQHISSGMVCDANDYTITNGVWSKVIIPLSSASPIRYIFNANFFGTGTIMIDSFYIGRMPVSTGIADISQTTVAVAPNPAQNYVQVTVPQSQNGKLTLLDMTGNIISVTHTDGKETLTLNIETLPSGVYILLYQDSSVSVSKKVVKE